MENGDTLKIIFTVVLGLIAIQIVTGVAENYTTTTAYHSVSNENITIADPSSGTTTSLSYYPVISGSETITTTCS